MSLATPQENAASKDTGPLDPGASSTASITERPRGRKRSHPTDALDDGAPPNVKLPTAVSYGDVYTRTLGEEVICTGSLIHMTTLCVDYDVRV